MKNCSGREGNGRSRRNSGERPGSKSGVEKNEIRLHVTTYSPGSVILRRVDPILDPT